METRQLLLENRQFMYAFFARAFAEEPDGDFFATVLGSHLAQEVALVEDEYSAALAEGLEEARRLLRDGGGWAPGASLASLGEEYVRVFVGPGSLPARPWETMHRTGKNTLFQPGVLEVRAAYRRSGFLPQRYPHVSDDFIGLEFDFMARLAALAFDAASEGDATEERAREEASLDFLQHHLLKWMSGFADGMQEHYGDCFYGAIASMAAAYLQRDRAVLEELLG
ncbi:TorD/DmsD family molecular chaperone [Parvibacter caecicola]|uniref:TorD/DmsD family molecular chaperone n=1 Tax=Parvibacter caecicola TaxID=747645 RepID=UPI00272F90D3|nr:molecular chaperone TorD family protein [Parvibacter caecicola]